MLSPLNELFELSTIIPLTGAIGMGVVAYKLWVAGKKNRAELSDFRKGSKSLAALTGEVEKFKSEKIALVRELQYLKSSVATYGSHSLLAMTGIYTPSYSLPDCATYKSAISENREAQKGLVKSFAAVSFYSDADTSAKALGVPTVALRGFNLECDALIGRISVSNYGDILRRIQRAYDLTNKQLAPLAIGISLEYLQLKNKEAQLVFEFNSLKAKESDERRAERDRVALAAKEEAELAAEVTDAGQALESSKHKLQAAETQLAISPEAKALIEQIQSLRALVQGNTERKERAQSMAQKTRSGYVYIISNIGSFGEHMFKVGMTRRLNPMGRVNELGDAAVPFTFDVHAFIFSDDAPALETSLHNELREYAVNKVNYKKEFFFTSLEVIVAAVNKHHGPFKFSTEPAALEYRQSLALAYPGQYPMPCTEPTPLEFVEFFPA